MSAQGCTERFGSLFKIVFGIGVSSLVVGLARIDCRRRCIGGVAGFWNQSDVSKENEGGHVEDRFVSAPNRLQWAIFLRSVTVSNKKFQQEKHDGCAEWPFEALEWYAFKPLVHLAFWNQAQFFFVDRVESLCALAQWDVKCVADRSDFLQSCFIESRSDGLAILVADEIGATISQGDGDRGTLRASDTHRVDGHSVFCGFLRGIDDRTLEVLTIG